MLNCFKNEKVLYALGGAAAVIVGNAILKSNKTRQLAVSGLAKGMKLQNDAKEAFQNMKDEAQDICCDAKAEAGIADGTEKEEDEA
jgi:3-polyprenyl-4-hydroxybenzoate decarboxylase